MRVSLNGSLKVKNMGAFLPLDFEKSDQLYQKSRAGHATISSRDNVTMLSGHKVVCNCHFTIFIVASCYPCLVPEAIVLFTNKRSKAKVSTVYLSHW